MVRYRKFKESAMQKVYDLFRESPPTSRNYVLGSPYYRGYEHPEWGPRLEPRGSAVYAAWAAGVDNRRQADAQAA